MAFSTSSTKIRGLPRCQPNVNKRKPWSKVSHRTISKLMIFAEGGSQNLFRRSDKSCKTNLNVINVQSPKTATPRAIAKATAIVIILVVIPRVIVVAMPKEDRTITDVEVVAETVTRNRARCPGETRGDQRARCPGVTRGAQRRTRKTRKPRNALKEMMIAQSTGRGTNGLNVG